MSLTVTDLFCGAGGSSSGAIQVPGVRVRIAANHWALAIETHNTNHPDTDHDCADLSQVDPRRYPRTDILWCSPECTNHSQAKGKKRNLDSTPDLFDETLPDEAADRSRATMWDVPRFAEHHLYRAVIVENVVDAAKWIMWPAWLHAMTCLGYEHHVVYLNSMHAQAAGLPAPQSRDRLYVVFWRKGDARPDFDKWLRPAAWCSSCSTAVRAVQSWKKHDKRWGRYRQQYVYRCPSVSCRNAIVEPAWLPAAAAIDWALPGERIGDRARPLAPKTRARIEAGLKRYARPMHLEAAGNTYDGATTGSRYYRIWPVDHPLATVHTTASKALLVPVEGRDGKTALPVADPMRTMTTRNETAMVVPLRTHGTAAPATEPLKTFVAGNVGQALVVPPFVVNGRADGIERRVSAISDELDTITASGNHLQLIVPLRNHNTAKSTGEPLDTVAAAGNHHALVMRNNEGGAEMSTPVEEVLRTLTTKGHQSLIQWAALYGYDTGQMRSPSDVLPTQTTVEGDALLGWSIPDVDDCLFRMLEPHEIARGMAFEQSYVILGNKRERVRQAGNAVTPPAARDLIACVAEALGSAA